MSQIREFLNLPLVCARRDSEFHIKIREFTVLRILRSIVMLPALLE